MEVTRRGRLERERRREIEEMGDKNGETRKGEKKGKRRWE